MIAKVTVNFDQGAAAPEIHSKFCMVKVILSATLAVNAFCYLRTGNLCFASIEKTSREYPVSDQSKPQKKKDVSMTGRRKTCRRQSVCEVLCGRCGWKRGAILKSCLRFWPSSIGQERLLLFDRGFSPPFPEWLYSKHPSGCRMKC